MSTCKQRPAINQLTILQATLAFTWSYMPKAFCVLPYKVQTLDIRLKTHKAPLMPYTTALIWINSYLSKSCSCLRFLHHSPATYLSFSSTRPPALQEVSDNQVLIFTGWSWYSGSLCTQVLRVFQCMTCRLPMRLSTLNLLSSADICGQVSHTSQLTSLSSFAAMSISERFSIPENHLSRKIRIN